MVLLIFSNANTILVIVACFQLQPAIKGNYQNIKNTSTKIHNDHQVLIKNDDMTLLLVVITYKSLSNNKMYNCNINTAKVLRSENFKICQ